MLFIIDCASHQGYPDWAQLKAEGHQGMITKVTGEQNYVNPYWSRNHDAARAAGLVPGTYDWVEPENAEWQDPEIAAIDYYRTVGARDYGSLLAVDFESPTWATGPLGTNIEGWMRRYMFALRELARKTIVFYSAPYFMRETGAERWGWLPQVAVYWMAAPGPKPQQFPVPDDADWPGPQTGPFESVTIHQHQWFATSGAVRGNFDRNRFQGSHADLGRLAGVTTTEAEVKEPEPGKWTTYINEQGNAMFVWNMGGQTDKILGVAAVDLGMTVQSASEPNTQVSRSIQGGVVTDFHESPKQV